MIDLHDLRKAGQRDGEPGCNRYPTSAWIAGDLISDRYRVPVAEDASPGEYTLLVSVYSEDGSVDVIDEAGARVRLRTMTRPPDLKEIDEEVEKLNKEKEDAVANQDFEKAANLRDQAEKLRKKKDQTNTVIHKSQQTNGVC